jgi:3-oxoacyl-[acyl-carrier-protein] synthase II
MRRVAVTGMGCVTPCGNSVEALWDNLSNGRSGIDRITKFDTEEMPVDIGAEVKDFVPQEFGIDDKNARRLDLFAQYGLAAAAQAMADAGLAEGGRPRAGAFDPEMTAVILGTGVGGLRGIEVQVDNMMRRGPGRVSPTLVPSAVADVAANEIAMLYGIKGPVCAVTTACSSGNDALAFACRLIKDGTADVVVSGGTEAALTPLSIATFGNLKALSRCDADPKTVCRPFDRGRSGFVMGEGAGVLILEELEHAKRRGARVHAILAGYGQTCDSYHKTAPDPTAAQASRAIVLALRMAGIPAEEIDYVNAHGTSTISNDPMETMAIKKSLGEHAYKTAVSSTKSMTGHLIGAAGAVEAIVTIQSIRTGVIPPTLNLDDPDPECDLDYVPHQARRRSVRVALNNTFGFGGHNAAVVFVAP